MISEICGITPDARMLRWKYLAVEAQGDHALLDPGAGAVVDADQRSVGLDREVLDPHDLLPVHLAEAAAEHGDALVDRVQRLLGAPAQVGELARGVVDVDGGGQQRQLIGFLKSRKELAERKNTHSNPENACVATSRLRECSVLLPQQSIHLIARYTTANRRYIPTCWPP